MSGGRSESHQSDPGVSVMLVSGLVKFTKRKSYCCWCGKKARNPFGGVQESMDRLGAWLSKGEYRVEAPWALDESARVAQGSKGPG